MLHLHLVLTSADQRVVVLGCVNLCPAVQVHEQPLTQSSDLMQSGYDLLGLHQMGNDALHLLQSRVTYCPGDVLMM